MDINMSGEHNASHLLGIEKPTSELGKLNKDTEKASDTKGLANQSQGHG
jgi:hypothetical protein